MFPVPRQRWVDTLASEGADIQSLPHEALIFHGREDRALPLESSLRLHHLIGDQQSGQSVFEWSHFKPKAGQLLRGDEWYRFAPDGTIAEIRAYYGHFDHYTIRARDVDVSAQFYRDILGFRAQVLDGFAFPFHLMFAGDQAIVHLIGAGALIDVRGNVANGRSGSNPAMRGHLLHGQSTPLGGLNSDDARGRGCASGLAEGLFGARSIWSTSMRFAHWFKSQARLGALFICCWAIF
jgi:catechol 2,3-dioxygenase-like lactoylglutathione lyase family enzyme